MPPLPTPYSKAAFKRQFPWQEQHFTILLVVIGDHGYVLVKKKNVNVSHECHFKASDSKKQVGLFLSHPLLACWWRLQDPRIEDSENEGPRVPESP